MRLIAGLGPAPPEPTAGPRARRLEVWQQPFVPLLVALRGALSGPAPSGLSVRLPLNGATVRG